MDASQFVNGSQNVCWFSGYAWGVQNNLFLLRQSADPKRILRFRVKRNFRPPVDNSPVEVKAHAVSWQGTPELHLLLVKRATVQSTRNRDFMLFPLLNIRRDEDPFEALRNARDRIRENMALDEATIEAILKEAGKGGKYANGYTNDLKLTGFLGSKTYIAPSDPSKPGYLRVMLSQYADGARDIPINIRGADQRLGSRLKKLMPLRVVADAVSAQDADGKVVIEFWSDPRRITQASNTDFENRKMPPWWQEACRNFYAEKMASSATEVTDRSPVTIRDKAEPAAAVASTDDAGLGTLPSDDELAAALAGGGTQDGAAPEVEGETKPRKRASRAKAAADGTESGEVA